MNFEERNKPVLASTHIILHGDGDNQHCDSAHLETGNGNRICTVIQLYIASATLCRV